MEERHLPLLFIYAIFHIFFSSANAQSFIGVNYGQVADNLPPPSATASLLQTTTISKLRLYGADPAVIQSFAGTNISLVVGVSNGDVASLASDPSAAGNWAAANVLAYLPASMISVVSVGNEAVSSGDASLVSNLLPAMQNLHSALSASAAGVKVSTVHSMAVLAQSDPPSSGAFQPDISSALTGILGFLRDTGSPFMINPYPFFAYRSDPRPETLSFCLFQPNSGRLDAGTKLTYTNMFDAQVDAVRSAINALGFPEVEIVVAETGWPYRGDPDEVGATVDNAKAFIGNLVTHLRSLVGTPLMPGRSVDTYLFALYDEDLKPGPLSERSFGIYRADQTMNYDAGLAKSSASTGSELAAPPPPPPPASTRPDSQTTGGVMQPKGWCAPGTTLQASQEGRPTQPGLQCYAANGVVGGRVVGRLLFSYGALTLLTTLHGGCSR